jgi:hypothetical protein
MQSAQSQPSQRQSQPRPKPIVVGAVRHADATPTRRRAFALPDVREIPRRAIAGPWEAGW